MTMSYRVENRELFDTVKVGDDIAAIVYMGDVQTLHRVSVVPRARRADPLAGDPDGRRR
jgi:hypothetical protein